MNVDKNFNLNDKISDNLLLLDPLDSKDITVYGFPFIDKDRAYLRLSKKFIMDYSVKLPNVCHLATNTSGGQLHFITTSKKVVIDCKLANNVTLSTMTPIGQGGFDIYVGSSYDDLLFYDSTRFDITKKEYRYEFDLRNQGKMRLVVINFPLYLGVSNLVVGIEKESTINFSKFNNDKKIVIYGTSITQGGCASRPGLSFPNILSRRLHYEFINLGFSGNAFGEIEVAKEISRIENVEMFILDYEANAGTSGMLANTLEDFIRTLREKHPSAKIVVVSRIKYLFEDLNEFANKRREIIRLFQEKIVRKLNKENDKNVYFIDGSKMLGDNYHEFTIDSIHPNDLGFMMIADYLEKSLRKLLKRLD